MNKNYTIEWRNPAKTILEIKYLGDAVLNDILSSNVDAFSMIETVPHEVLLIQFKVLKRLFFDPRSESLPRFQTIYKKIISYQANTNRID